MQKNRNKNWNTREKRQTFQHVSTIPLQTKTERVGGQNRKVRDI